MALKKIYIGSVGAYLFDDADPVDDPDGDFPGESYRAIVTDDQLFVGRAPAIDEEVIRLIDLGLRLLPPVIAANIDNPTELNTVAGDLGALVLAYEIIGAGGQNEYTLYAYDASGPGVNSPYVVDADGAGDERWIAVAGKYAAQGFSILGNIALTGTVDGVDLAAFAAAYVAHIANVNAHHAQVHNVNSHSDVNLLGLVNHDLMRWDDPSSKWIPKDIMEVIFLQNINPGRCYVGDVGGGNYAEIKTDGEINLHGTARVTNHVRVAAPSWAKGATAPTTGFVGIFPVLSFGTVGPDDEAHYSLICPLRMAAGAAITVIVDWCYTGAPDVGTVKWDLEYKTIQPGEALVAGTTTITGTSAGGHTSGQLVRTTLGVGITGAVAHDVIGLRLFRNVAGDTLVTDAHLVQVHFMFTSDRLGEAT